MDSHSGSRTAGSKDTDRSYKSAPLPHVKIPIGRQPRHGHAPPLAKPSHGIVHGEGPKHRLVLMAILVRDEHVLALELLEQSRWFAEVGGQHVGRVHGYPFRQVDLLVDPGVEPDEDAARLVADVL